MNTDNERLSTEEYWNKVLSDAQLPRCNNESVYNYKVTMDFIHDIIKDKKFTTFLEVGCGSSGWLPYFAKKYGYKVSGVDYSEVGCRICEENIKMQNIQYGSIFCKDLFDINCTNGEKYDIIFTYGVVEHFDNPESVVAQLVRLLNPSGIIITLVPNINGLNGFLSRVFVKEIYHMHKVIDKIQLKNYHTNNGFNDIKTDYVGILSLAVIPWIRSNTWLFIENSIQRKLSLYTIKIISIIFEFFFKKLPSNLGKSKFFSPYIISICGR